MKRRELVKGMAAATLLAGHPQLAAEDSSMSILFMGGTGFIGPHTVRALVERGHRCTLFNRGKTNPDLFPDLELIKGDRLSDDIRQLRGRRWDVVIDTSAYVPRAVNTLLDQLGPDGVEHYVFISTISVYANFGTPGIDENAPRLVLPDPDRPKEVYGYVSSTVRNGLVDQIRSRTSKERAMEAVGVDGK